MRVLSQIALAAAVVLAASAGVAAGDDRFDRADTALGTVLDRYSIPGAALAIARDGAVLHARGFGYADVAAKTPVKPDSLFLIASVSKTLTAMAVLKLVEEHKLSLDDEAFSFVADLPQPAGTTRDPRLAAITVRDLLDHAGGWDRSSHGEPASKIEEIHHVLGTTGDPTPQDVIRYVMTLPLDFAPGTCSAYSNFGYILAGEIVARVSHEPYERFVRENVLVPAGVTDAAISHLPAALPGEVFRYGDGGAKLENGSALATSAAGGWVLSALDYVKILAALHAGRILGDASLDAMFAPPYPPLQARKNGTAFGLGWDTVGRNVQGRLYYAKNGVLPGIRTWVQHRAGGLDVILFTNGNGSSNGDDEAGIKAGIAAVDAALDS